MMKSPYSSALVSRSTGFLLPLSLLFVLLGIASIILSAIDLGSSRTLLLDGPTNALISQPSGYSEQSHWPSLGKGIWSGLLFVALGIVSFVAEREKTLISVRLVCLLSFVVLFVSLYLFLSSILVFQRSIVLGAGTSHEQRQVVLNALLLVVGVLTFLASLFSAIGTLIVGNFCQAEDTDVEEEGQAPPSYFA